MSKARFPDFDGWTVAYQARETRHELLFTKPHPAGKDGKLTVWATIGADGDPQIAYLVGKRDAYAEDVRVSPPDDVALWQERFAAAQRAVVAGKIRRRLARGFDTPAQATAYATERMVKAGFSFAEMAEVMGEK